MISLEVLDIPQKKLNQFYAKGIKSIGDLLNFYPRNYKDLALKDLTMVSDGDFFSTVVTVNNIYNNPKNIVVKCTDENGKPLSITWFNARYIAKTTLFGEKYFVAGVMNSFRNEPNITNPEIFELYNGNEPTLLPVYSEIKDMSSSYLQSTVKKALNYVEDDYLEPYLREKLKLPERKQSLSLVHNPTNVMDVSVASRRLRFDDLFNFQFRLRLMRDSKRYPTTIIPKKYDLANSIIKQLPYKLTKGEGQLNALKTMFETIKRGEQINALVQGDVGCGKTIVAIIMMALFCENGYQSVLMAPTQVLAEQHYKAINELLDIHGIKTALLLGTTKTKEKRKILKELKSGEIQLLVGTHAVVSKDVEFKNLGLAITDEEHKFGVMQREALNDKSEHRIHSIIMSATPIPRSIAMSIYGNALDIITISELPAGRLPIKTKVEYKLDYVYGHMLSEIKKGRQCYVVCPLIEDSKKMESVTSIETAYQELLSYFGSHGVKIGVINGKMDKADIENIINDFKDLKYDMLLSTTIIEVGVNVPNATIILIRNAERFGLAQLHQLRGRVGRNSLQSYCYLESSFPTERLAIMEQTNDGFKIAMADLKNRGVGELLGTEQSGDSNCIYLLLNYEKMNSVILQEIDMIFQNKNRLEHYSNALLDVKTLKVSA